jgi:hypothetical protein
MIPDECSPPRPEIEASRPALQPANDNGVKATVDNDPLGNRKPVALWHGMAKWHIDELKKTFNIRYMR